MRPDGGFRAPTPPPHNESLSASWGADRHHQPSHHQADKHSSTASYNNRQFEEGARGGHRQRRGELEESRTEDRRMPPSPYERRALSPTMDNRMDGPQPPRRFPEPSFSSHSTAPRSPTILRRDTFNDRPSFPETTHRTSYANGPEPTLPNWRREQLPQGTQPSALPSAPIHLDRGRVFEQDTNLDLPRQSKPVRIRRPLPSPAPPPVQSHSEEYHVQPEVMVDRWLPNTNGHNEEQTREDAAPGVRAYTNNHHPRPTPSRRGTSLLDRLSSDRPSTSLVDRVHIPSKRHREEIGGDDVSADYEYEDGPADSQRRGAVPRRMKVKKGKRIGP